MKPAPGTLLIANPHLDDPNFFRAVVFLCEYNSEGAFGFVLNRKLDVTTEDLIPELAGFPCPVSEGGPVELNTLHFLHRCPQQFMDGREVVPGIFWGGDFQTLKDQMRAGEVESSDVRFFLGYSGWETGQLEAEIDEGTWIVCNAQPHFVFETKDTELWKNVLKELGGDYQFLANAPLDPRMN